MTDQPIERVYSWGRPLTRAELEAEKAQRRAEDAARLAERVRAASPPPRPASKPKPPATPPPPPPVPRREEPTLVLRGKERTAVLRLIESVVDPR